MNLDDASYLQKIFYTAALYARKGDIETARKLFKIFWLYKKEWRKCAA